MLRKRRGQAHTIGSSTILPPHWFRWQRRLRGYNVFFLLKLIFLLKGNIWMWFLENACNETCPCVRDSHYFFYINIYRNTQWTINYPSLYYNQVIPKRIQLLGNRVFELTRPQIFIWICVIICAENLSFFEPGAVSYICLHFQRVSHVLTSLQRKMFTFPEAIKSQKWWIYEVFISKLEKPEIIWQVEKNFPEAYQFTLNLFLPYIFLVEESNWSSSSFKYWAKSIFSK